jgi:hypothetical protein
VAFAYLKRFYNSEPEGVLMFKFSTNIFQYEIRRQNPVFFTYLAPLLKKPV